MYGYKTTCFWYLLAYFCRIRIHKRYRSRHKRSESDACSSPPRLCRPTLPYWPLSIWPSVWRSSESLLLTSPNPRIANLYRWNSPWKNWNSYLFHFFHCEFKPQKNDKKKKIYLALVSCVFVPRHLAFVSCVFAPIGVADLVYYKR